MEIAEQILCWLVGLILIVAAFRFIVHEKLAMAFVMFLFAIGCFIVGLSGVQQLFRTGLLWQVKSSLMSYGQKLEGFQTNVLSMRAELAEHQTVIDKHQQELASQQGRIRDAQTNIELQQIKIQDVSLLVDNIFSRMTFETFAGSETNRMLSQKLAGISNTTWKAIVKLRYVPIPRSLQGTVAIRGSVSQPLDSPIISSNNLAVIYLVGDWPIPDVVITLQYIMDARRTNLIQKVEFRGNDILVQGQQFPLKDNNVEP